MGCSHTIIPASEGHLFACPGSRIGSRVRWIRAKMTSWWCKIPSDHPDGVSAASPARRSSSRSGRSTRPLLNSVGPSCRQLLEAGERPDQGAAELAAVIASLAVGRYDDAAYGAHRPRCNMANSRLAVRVVVVRSAGALRGRRTPGRATAPDPCWSYARLTLAGSVRSRVTDGADETVSRCRPLYATASSEISERQRVRKSRRCSASETWPSPRRGTRKYCRSSSNAAQNRDADSKLPNPSIG